VIIFYSVIGVIYLSCGFLLAFCGRKLNAGKVVSIGWCLITIGALCLIAAIGSAGE
jgi:hypothetical protein